MAYLYLQGICTKSIFILALLISIGAYTNNSFAQCNVIGPTPDGGEEVECTGNVAGDTTTTDNDDIVNISGAVISGINEAISTIGGADNITMNGGSITGVVGINSGSDADIININDASFINTDRCVNASSGSGDVIVIDNSTFTCSGGDGVAGSSGNGDQITVSNVQITAGENAIDAGSGSDDEITIGDNVLLSSPGAKINCGSGNNDSLTFAMVVSAEAFNHLSIQIANGQEFGNIVINGFFYTWNDCEVLINDLTIGTPITRMIPVPTLSEWGLIAMAVILGLAGYVVIRKKAVA